MHPHGRALAHKRLRQLIINAKLVYRVSRLMDHRKQRGIKLVLVMCRHPHIAIVEIGCKRMRAFPEHAAPEIKADVLCNKLGKLPLLRLGIIPRQEIIVNPHAALRHLL